MATSTFPLSGKEKQFATDSQQPAKRTRDLDLTIVECTVCSKPLSETVYQCRNCHPACISCILRRCRLCKKPISISRCTPVQMQSLQVSCKHASFGCKKMLKIKDREEHENQCEHALDSHCPVPGCTHRANKFTLPVHLTKEHKVRTVELNVVSRIVGIRMAPSERFVMVEGVRKEMFLVHHEAKDPAPGDFFFSTSFAPEQIFFCTSFGVQNRVYDLKVSHGCPLWEQAYSMAGAKVEDIRQIDKCRNGPRLVFTPSCGSLPMNCGFDILLGVFPSAVMWTKAHNAPEQLP